MAVDSTIQSELTEFIVTTYLFGDVKRTPLDDEDLIEAGIIDSTSVLELIEFLGVRISALRSLMPRPCRANLGSVSISSVCRG